MNLINIFNAKRKIYLFTRNDKGEQIIKEDNSFFPYFYEINKDGEGNYISFDGKKLKKIFVSEPSNVPKRRTDNAYEADILFTKRYMIDRIKTIDKSSIKSCFLDLEILCEEFPDVMKANKPISCISVHNSFTKEIKTWYLGDYGDYDGKNYALSVADREKLLIKDFIGYMKKESFDLILGWNFQKFDYPYLINRFDHLKIDLGYSKRDNFANVISPINQLRYGDGLVFYPAGISIIDYMEWDKKVTLNRRKSYSLDNVAQEVLKDEPNEKVDFSKLSLELKEKNIRDVKRMVQLEEKLKYIDYFDEIRRLSKVDFEDMIWNSRIVDMLLLQESKNKKTPLPMKPAEERGTLEEKTEYKGAYRDTFKTGRLSPVGSYDLSSCYPSMIVDFCLDPTNIIEKEGNEIKTGIIIEGTKFNQNPNTLLPTVTNKLLTLKNQIKQNLSTLKLNTQQYKNEKVKYEAIKGIVNSAYGVFGNRFFRLYDIRVASAITFLARDLLYYIPDKIEKQGKDIVYIDTDGIMINNNDKDISEELNRLVNQWGKEKYDKDKLITYFSYEGYFNPIIILAKCRWKGWLNTKKGIEEKSKGIEAKRKDSTKFMKEFQITLLDKIKVNEPKEKIFEWIKDQIKKVKEIPLKDIAFPCKLSKKPSEYLNVPIFVRALNNTPNFKKKVGNNFYYIFVKPDDTLKIATNIYLDNEIVETLDKNLTRKEGINYIRNKLRKPELETSKIKVLHQRERTKDVMAFDSDNYAHIKEDMIDWDMMIKRNIWYKLDTIFEAMNWDIKEIGYQPTLKIPKIKAKPAQIKVKRVKPIERPQEAEKPKITPFYEENETSEPTISQQSKDMSEKASIEKVDNLLDERGLMYPPKVQSTETSETNAGENQEPPKQEITPYYSE